MKKIRCIIGCFVFLTVLGTVQVFATVLDVQVIGLSDSQIIPGAIVVLDSPSGQETEATTDSNGLASFGDLAAGTYTLQIFYRSPSVRVQIDIDGSIAEIEYPFVVNPTDAVSDDDWLTGYLQGLGQGLQPANLLCQGPQDTAPTHEGCTATSTDTVNLQYQAYPTMKQCILAPQNKVLCGTTISQPCSVDPISTEIVTSTATTQYFLNCETAGSTASAPDWVADSVTVNVPDVSKIQIGDMIFDPSQVPASYTTGTRVRKKLAAGGSAIRGTITYNLWPGGVIPVVFDASITDPVKKQMFWDACNEWASAAKIQCVSRSSEIYPYLLVVETDPMGDGQACSCDLGAGPPGNHAPRIIHLPGIVNPPGDQLTCWMHPIILHELGHALGFVHEHQRNDRDTYLTINYQNILAGYDNNFDLLTTIKDLGPYDYLSIMHYKRDAFSSNALDTMDPKPGNEMYLDRMGRNLILSDGDRMGVAKLYGQVPLSITQQPANLTLDPGQNSSFGVQPIGGLAPYTYQWQLSQPQITPPTPFFNYSGATSHVWGFGVGLADNGSQVRVNVCDSAAPANCVMSDIATLTVNSLTPPSTTPSTPTGSACDMNGDGSVNIIDIQLVTAQASGSATCTNGDLNHDGACDIVDVSIVSNAAVGGACETTSTPPPPPPSALPPPTVEPSPPPPPPTTPPPTVTVTDINNDGATNVADIQLEVNQALGVTPCTIDLNNDGICTVVDIQRIVNVMLGVQ